MQNTQVNKWIDRLIDGYIGIDGQIWYRLGMDRLINRYQLGELRKIFIKIDIVNNEIRYSIKMDRQIDRLIYIYQA